MKLASLSDLHLTNDLPYTPPGDTYRKKLLIKYLYKFFKEIKKEKVDALLIPGDVCHQSALLADDVDLLYVLMSCIVNTKIPTVISTGNHDLDGDSSILKFLKRASKAFGNLYYSEKLVWRKVFKDKDLTVDIINSCTYHKFLDVVKKLKKREPGTKYSVLIGHVGVKGALHGSTKSIVGVKPEDIEDISENYDAVVLGHFHCFQWVTSKCFYVGSCQQTRLDEALTQPGGIVFTLPNLVHTRILNEVSPRFSVIDDYSLDEERVRGMIVKPVLDLEGKSKLENLGFIASLNDMDPYYLIKPRIAKVFTTEETGAISYGKADKTKALIKTMKTFKVKKAKAKELYDHTMEIWNETSN